MDVFNTLLVFFQNYGYAAVFAALLLCGAGVPIPEDVTLVAGGALAYYSAKRYARIRFFRQHRAYVMRQREEYLRKHNLKSSEADFRSEEYRRFHLKFLRKERLRLRNLFFFDFLFSRSKGKNKLLEPLSHLWGRKFLAKASAHWGEPAQDDPESDGGAEAQDAEEDGAGRAARPAGGDSLGGSGNGSENGLKGGVAAADADRRGAVPGAGPKGPAGDEPNDPPGRDPASPQSQAGLEADLGRPRPGCASEKEQSCVEKGKAAQGNDEADAK